MRADSFIELIEAVCLGFWGESRNMSVVGFGEGTS